MNGTRAGEGLIPKGLSGRSIHRMAWPMSLDVAQGPAWLGQMSPAFPHEHPAAQSNPFSRTVTSRPRLLSSSAIEAPTAPAPMTATSALFLILPSDATEQPLLWSGTGTGPGRSRHDATSPYPATEIIR